jgi:hypothetical protein
MHPSQRPSSPVPRVILLSLVVGAVGCKPRPPDGFYVWCDGHGALYHMNNRGQPVDRVSLCLDESFLNETGLGDTGGESGEINLGEWTNDTEDIDYLRTMCEQKCKVLAWGDRANSNCSPDEDHAWEIQNYKEIPTPDPLMIIDDPWHLHCHLPVANIAPFPGDTLVVPPDQPIAWPGTSESVTLDCEDFKTCAAQFDAAISTVLYHDDTADLWGANMGFADYLATTSTSSSQLELRISNPGGTPSSDWYDVDGRVEYSAPDCGETECPFYLANFTLTNTEDTWALVSDALGAVVHISDITVQLRRPTLGVWKPSTNQIFVGAERMDIYVFVTHQIGAQAPVEGGYLVTNANAVFGEIHVDGGIQILGLAAGDGSSLELEADLIHDTLAGEPPTADLGMEDTVMAPSEEGLPVSSLTDASWDPDNDIAENLWFVDGVERLSSYVIAPGIHTVALRVIDERGATDVDERVVEVLSP